SMSMPKAPKANSMSPRPEFHPFGPEPSKPILSQQRNRLVECMNTLVRPWPLQRLERIYCVCSGGAALEANSRNPWWCSQQRLFYLGRVGTTIAAGERWHQSLNSRKRRITGDVARPAISLDVRFP